MTWINEFILTTDAATALRCELLNVLEVTLVVHLQRSQQETERNRQLSSESHVQLPDLSYGSVFTSVGNMNLTIGIGKIMIITSTMKSEVTNAICRSKVLTHWVDKLKTDVHQVDQWPLHAKRRAKKKEIAQMMIIVIKAHVILPNHVEVRATNMRVKTASGSCGLPMTGARYLIACSCTPIPKSGKQGSVCTGFSMNLPTIRDTPVPTVRI